MLDFIGDNNKIKLPTNWTNNNLLFTKERVDLINGDYHRSYIMIFIHIVNPKHTQKKECYIILSTMYILPETEIILN